MANLNEARNFAQLIKQLLRDWSAMEKWTDGKGFSEGLDGARAQTRSL